MTFKHFDKALLLPLLFALFTVPQMSTSASAGQPFSLRAIHQGLFSRYPGVSHLSPVQLQNALNGPLRKDFLVLDASQADEFAVSHIKGARRVDPSIWHAAFMKKFGAAAKNKTVVIYCSVGERSSKLAKYVQQSLLQKGAKAVYNLQGGIFKWHNDQRPLVNNKGATRFVHPYDKHWGRLLKRAGLARYSPR